MTWQMWALSIPFISLIVAALAVKLFCNRRECFASDPDALEQSLNGCDECDDRPECIIRRPVTYDDIGRTVNCDKGAGQLLRLQHTSGGAMARIALQSGVYVCKADGVTVIE